MYLGSIFLLINVLEVAAVVNLKDQEILQLVNETMQRVQPFSLVKTEDDVEMFKHISLQEVCNKSVTKNGIRVLQDDAS